MKDTKYDYNIEMTLCVISTSMEIMIFESY